MKWPEFIAALDAAKAVIRQLRYGRSLAARPTLARICRSSTQSRQQLCLDTDIIAGLAILELRPGRAAITPMEATSERMPYRNISILVTIHRYFFPNARGVISVHFAFI